MLRKTLLYLLRHAPTDWNEQGRIQGRTDRPLSEKGKKEAETTAELLFSEGMQFAAIYASPLLRSRETAEIISRKFDCQIFYMQDLIEANWGEMEGLTKAEFKKKYKDRLKISEGLPSQQRFKFKVVPNCESSEEIANRVVACLGKIAAAHEGGSLLVVTHGWVMRSLYILLAMPEDDRTIFINNQALMRFEISSQGELALMGHRGIEAKSWLD